MWYVHPSFRQAKHTDLQSAAERTNQSTNAPFQITSIKKEAKTYSNSNDEATAILIGLRN